MFSKVETDNLHLSPNGADIICKWRLMTSGSDGKSDDTEKESNETRSTSGSGHSEAEEDRWPATSEQLIFKCIGTTKNSHYQYVIQRARDIKASGSHVPVKLVHEPRNPRDSRAIAFMCESGKLWDMS